MSKHAPGPWMIDGNDISPEAHLELSICCMQPADFDASNAKSWVYGDATKANARLIAAAPDLLEALEACLDYGSLTGAEWVLEKARAAIARARGEA
jgi:hypothetical protein